MRTRPVEETGLVIEAQGRNLIHMRSPPLSYTHWISSVGMWNECDTRRCSSFFAFLFVQHLPFNRPVEDAIGFPSPHILHLPSSLYHYSYTYMLPFICSVSLSGSHCQTLSSNPLLHNPLLRYPDPAFYPSPLPPTPLCFPASLFFLSRNPPTPDVKRSAP